MTPAVVILSTSLKRCKTHNMITSLSNERVKSARKLHSKQGRNRSGLLLIEGVRLVDDALRSGAIPEQVFYTSHALVDGQSSAVLLHRLRDLHIRCDEVTEQVLRSLSETVTPQGIVVVVRVPQIPVPEESTLCLILDGVTDPGNAGTLLRSAEAAGVELVIFSSGTVDAFNDKVVRAAMGAHFRLPLLQLSDWDRVVTAVRTASRLYVADADSEVSYDKVDWVEPAALIVGSEATGPSKEAFSVAIGITIPMRGQAESLNAAMAGTVILFEAARQRAQGTVL